jgi:hypothetical protein
MKGVLASAIKLWVFGSPRGLQVPTFGSVSFIFTLSPKWGCDKKGDYSFTFCEPFIQRLNFCFWVCISSFNNKANNYTSHEGSKFLGFACWCFVLFLNLSKLSCCVYHISVVCFDFVVVACHTFYMFLKLLKLEMWSINANGKFLRWDLKSLSIEFWLLQRDHVVLLFSSKE